MKKNAIRTVNEVVSSDLEITMGEKLRFVRLIGQPRGAEPQNEHPANNGASDNVLICWLLLLYLLGWAQFHKK